MTCITYFISQTTGLVKVKKRKQKYIRSCPYASSNATKELSIKHLQEIDGL